MMKGEKYMKRKTLIFSIIVLSIIIAGIIGILFSKQKITNQAIAEKR